MLHWHAVAQTGCDGAARTAALRLICCWLLNAVFDASYRPVQPAAATTVAAAALPAPALPSAALPAPTLASPALSPAALASPALSALSAATLAPS